MIKEPEYINTFSDEVRKDCLSPIYEMANTLDRYKKDLRGISGIVYQHVIYICVLAGRLPYEAHWKKELKTLLLPVVDTTIKKESTHSDRSRYIKSEMMRPHMGERFQDYCTEQFEYALDIEIRKGEKMLRDDEYRNHWASVKRELVFIEETRNNLDGIPEKFLDTIKKFYEDLCSAATERNPDAILDAVDQLKPVIV